jgi:hypothetical protein
MTETPRPHGNPKGRFLRLPRRKGLWLFDYEQVKYDTPFQHTASSILGCLALAFAVVVFWAMWASRTGTWMDALFVVAALAYGLASAPVGIISWIRRRRGEPTELFDYELVKPGKEEGPKGSDHAPNHR